MSIKITGMYSGLDTESIINELASAQSYKKTKLVKAQTKLSWKQDAWKALNTKIYSFYTNVLDNMRFQSSYMKKKTSVSNSSALNVITGADAVDGVRTVSTDQLAKTAYLTGGSIAQGSTYFTGYATLSQLGFTGTGSISLSGGNGASFDLELTGDMTINSVIEKIQSTGLNASFDQDNQRIFISSNNTGAVNNFTITGNDEEGMNALAALGLLSTNDLKSDVNKLWASYATEEGADAYQKAIDAEVQSRADAYKAKNDALQSDIDAYTEANEQNLAELEELTGYDENETTASVYERLYGHDETVTKEKEGLTAVDGTDEDGNAYTVYTGTDGKVVYKVDADGNYFDADGNTIYTKTDDGYVDADGNAVTISVTGSAEGTEGADGTEGTGGTVTIETSVTKHVDGDLQKAVSDAETALQEAQKNLEESGAEEGSDKYTELQQAVTDAQTALDSAQTAYDNAKTRYNYLYAIDHNKQGITDCKAQIEENSKYYTEDKDENGAATGTEDLEEIVTAEFDKKVAAAYAAYNGDYDDKATAIKIDGQDAKITVNGAEFTSTSNTFTINGLTLTVLEEGQNVTLTTSDDTDGIYDMIKNFFSEYNKLINEMDSLYNADSASDYEPLTSEEKESMSDSEIEEWEEKIKASLLRRDSTLSDVASAMKNVLLAGTTVNGKQMYLSDFGINTLGYFNAAENERNAYHIDGDSDDSSVSANEDVLKSMIASDPDTVMNFFSQLSANLYTTLSDKMATSTVSSAFTVYNDKSMKDEYDDYTDKIAEEEEKLNDLIDKWYDKFSAMETALAKLESKSSSLSSLLGS